MIKSYYCYVTTLLLTLFFFCNIHAQANQYPMLFTLNIGASFPQGVFAKTSGSNPGFANKGFSFTIEASKGLNDYLSWVSSISMSINGFNTAGLESQVPPLKVSSGRYYSCWGMSGFRLESFVLPAFKIYGLSQLGVLYLSAPDVYLSYKEYQFNQRISSDPAFAYAVGVGMIIYNINIGIKYFNSRTVNKHSESYGGAFNITTASAPVTILQFLVGYYF
jgi:hypothetical protein